MKKLLEAYFKFVKKLLSKKKQGSSVGLDIGTNECKLVELTKNDDGRYELLNIAIEPIANAEISPAIQKAITHLNVPCKSCYTSILGKGTLIRYIEMPKMSIDELKKSFAIEADKYFPFGQDKVYTDCYIIDSKYKGNQMLVMAGAARKELVDQRMKLLSSLGLQADFIGINSIAVANIINVLGYGVDVDKEAAVAVLDMGDSVTHLMIMMNQLPRFDRDIFIGGRDFTRSISNTLGVSIQVAEGLKINPADKKEEVMNACESVILNLIQELKLSLDYFTTENNREIKQVLLTGGGSLLNGISDLFNKNLEIKVSQWDPFQGIKISSNLKTGESKNNFSKFTVALGLSLYEYD